MKRLIVFTLLMMFSFAACKKEEGQQNVVKKGSKKTVEKTKSEPKKVIKKNYKFPVAGDPENALVRLYILSDFQCPICKMAAVGIKGLIPELIKQKIAFIYVPYPLKMHQKAMGAAMAAMAAFKQGKFWEFHDKLFENQRSLGNDFYIKVAKELNLDLNKFKKDMNSPEIKKEIEYGLKIIEKLGVRGTPSFLINGKLQVGWGSANGIKSSILNEKKQVENLIKQGKTPQQAYMERFKNFILNFEVKLLNIKVFQSNQDINDFFNKLTK